MTVTAWVHDYAPPIRAMILATAAFHVKLYVPFAIPVPSDSSTVVCEELREIENAHARSRAGRSVTIPIRSSFGKSRSTCFWIFTTPRNGWWPMPARFETPTLMIGAGKDWVVSLKTQKVFFDRLSSAEKRFKIFPDAYHAIFHETNRREVVDLVREYILERFAKPPEPVSHLNSDKTGYTADEYERLKRNGSPAFAIVRGGLAIAGRLSRGIEIGSYYGFDSGLSLDYVYKNEPHGSLGVGRLIDQAYLNSIGWRGIRRRKANLEKSLRDLVFKVHDEGSAGKNSRRGRGCGTLCHRDDSCRCQKFRLLRHFAITNRRMSKPRVLWPTN